MTLGRLNPLARDPAEATQLGIALLLGFFGALAISQKFTAPLKIGLWEVIRLRNGNRLPGLYKGAAEIVVRTEKLRGNNTRTVDLPASSHGLTLPVRALFVTKRRQWIDARGAPCR
jgi:hypothetical protein